MTHLHLDHASGISEFPDATFVVSEAEWEAATTDSRPLLRGYRRAHYDYAFDYRTVDFDARPRSTPTRPSAAPSTSSATAASGSPSRPGHSAGHQSVICRLRDRDFVIAGDADLHAAASSTDAPEPPRPLDRHNWRRSLQELQLFRRSTRTR